MSFDFSLAGKVADGARLGELYAPIREHGPVFWNEALGGWVVCGYHEVKAVLRRNREFGNGGSPQRSAFGYDAMLFHDGGLHNRMRAVWANAVLPAAISGRMEQLGRIAAARHAPVLAALDRGETVDLVPVFQDFTADVTTTLMALPDARRADFKRWNAIISGTAQLALFPDDPRIAERDAARAELYTFLGEEVARHKARLAAGEAPANFTAMMIAAEGQEGITGQIVLDNMVNLFLGALDTTVRLMGTVTVQLLDRRDVLEAVAQDFSRFAPALEEIHRYQPVVQVTTRHVETGTIELGGHTLRQGDIVYVMPGMANWDAGVFAQPEVLDIARQSDPERQHVAFGFGMHQCLGMHLARAEIAAFFRPLLDGMKRWEIAAMDYGPGWSLWGPVALEVRKATAA